MPRGARRLELVASWMAVAGHERVEILDGEQHPSAELDPGNVSPRLEPAQRAPAEAQVLGGLVQVEVSRPRGRWRGDARTVAREQLGDALRDRLRQQSEQGLRGGNSSLAGFSAHQRTVASRQSRAAGFTRTRASSEKATLEALARIGRFRPERKNARRSSPQVTALSLLCSSTAPRRRSGPAIQPASVSRRKNAHVQHDRRQR